MGQIILADETGAGNIILNATDSSSTDADGDIIIGDEDELIMIRSGGPSDKEYYITIEKV